MSRRLLAGIGLALLALVALGLIEPTTGAHVYHGRVNGGVVLWDCGPGLEVYGTPGLFWEDEC